MSNDTTTETTDAPSTFTWTDDYPYDPAWDSQPEPDDNFWPEPRWGRRIAVLVVIAALVAVVAITYSILSKSEEPLTVDLTATPACFDGTPVYEMDVLIDNPQGLEITGYMPSIFDQEGWESTIIVWYMSPGGEELSTSDSVIMPPLGDPCAITA